MLPTLLSILTTLFVARAAPISINSTVVCSAGQCLQGFTNTTSTQQPSTSVTVLTDLYTKSAPYYHRLMYPPTSFSFLASIRRLLIRSCSINFLRVLRPHPHLLRASMLQLFLFLSTSPYSLVSLSIPRPCIQDRRNFQPCQLPHHPIAHQPPFPLVQSPCHPTSGLL
jgi:hypothetical protein